MSADYVGVRGVLLAASGVTAIVGSGSQARIYPIRAPQDPRVPFIVISRIGAQRRQLYEGPSQVTTLSVQVDMFEKTAAKVRTLAGAVRVALNGYAGTSGGVVIQGAFLESERDMWEEAVAVYRCSQIYDVTFTEALA